jgi:hypothetical protein
MFIKSSPISWIWCHIGARLDQSPNLSVTYTFVPGWACGYKMLNENEFLSKCKLKYFNRFFHLRCSLAEDYAELTCFMRSAIGIIVTFPDNTPCIITTGLYALIHVFNNKYIYINHHFSLTAIIYDTFLLSLYALQAKA